MATLVCEAIEILTDTGLGVPVAYTNTAVGLATDGHFYLITDRPTISAVTGDTTRTVWYQGILTRDYGNWTLSRNIDFVEAGAFESVSDFNVGIKNTSDFRNTLQSNGVYLGRRRVKYYRATSTDGATWNFELRWTGIIDDQPFNERTFSLRCISVAKDIFGSLPTVPVNDSTFPGSPKDSRDKMVPIAIGRVAHSQMVNVTGGGAKVDLAKVSDGTVYDFCPSIGQNPSEPNVILMNGPPTLSQGIVFVADDARLVGKYLVVIVGKSQAIKILGNYATSGVGLTQVILAEPLDVFGETYYGYLDTGAGETRENAWWFEVRDLRPTLIASSRPVSSFEVNGTGRVSMETYNGDQKDYDDISVNDVRSDSANINAAGYPGVNLLANNGDDSGTIYGDVFLPPSSAEVETLTEWTTTGGLSVGGQAPNLIDQGAGGSYTLTASIPALGSIKVISVKLTLPPDLKEREYAEIYLLPDFRHHYNTNPHTTRINIEVWGEDIYGSELDLIFPSYEAMNSSLGTSFVDFHRLPGSYVDSSRSDTLFYTQRGNYEVGTFLGDSKKMRAYNVLHMKLTIESSGPADTYVLELQEIGLVGKLAIAVNNEPVYSCLKGEVYGTTMDARVSATDYPASVSRALEYLIRNYDESAPIWEASKAYAAGEKVRGTTDTGHIFVCTVAGTSSASEPTWTDTAAATYTDSSVTWKEHHEIPIDTTSFDAAHVNRGLWLVGRTLTEKKKSLDYYQSLLAQSFLLGTMTPAGKVQIKAWLQNTTVLTAFSEANILQGSLSDITLTPVRRMYNEPRVKYDKNPGSGKFNKQIAITNIDKPAFPGPTAGSVPPISVGTFSATFEPSGSDYFIVISTADPHPFATGDYASLSGNSEGYNFTSLPVSVLTTNLFTVLTSSFTFLDVLTTSGNLYKDVTYRLKWKDYVAGIDNYSTAKDLWDQCHNSYLVTQAINPLPDELGECEWFFDPYATDPNGALLWPDLDVGDMHAATGFVEGVANWTAWQKKQVTFETVDNATFSPRGLGDCVSFTDSKLTSGSVLTGWIHEKTQLPRTEKQPERFRWGVTLYPEALSVYTPPGYIEEHGASNIIDEHGATNIIEEHGA